MAEEPEGLCYIEQVEALVESFRYEFCDFCDADLDRHTIGPDPLGNAHLYCKIEPDDICRHCGRMIARDDSGVWFHTRSGLPPCDQSKVDPEAYTDTEGDEYDIATPSNEDSIDPVSDYMRTHGVDERAAIAALSGTRSKG